MKECTLVVMAAGMGSRFGGLKQITPVDEEKNFIIDYSVYDAKKAGFTKVVFVIKEENLNLFESTIGSRLKKQIKVEYAFQRPEDIPSDFDIKKREKPWGTVQAILCTKPYVDGPFAVINADDFYGFDALKKAHEFLMKNTSPYTYASIAYPLGSTMSENGSVKRGVLFLENNLVKTIIESNIEQKDGELIATPLDGRKPLKVQKEDPVSMNMFAFQHDIYRLLEEYFTNFFKMPEEDLIKKEALLPDCLEENLRNNKIKILCEKTASQWLGMTYISDLEIVKKELEQLKEKGVYPQKLWE